MLSNKTYLTSLKPKLNKMQFAAPNSLILVNRKTQSKRKFITLLSKKRGEEQLKVRIEDLFTLFSILSSPLKFLHLLGSLIISKKMVMTNQQSLRSMKKMNLNLTWIEKHQVIWILMRIKIQLYTEICLRKFSIVISLAQWQSLPLQLPMIPSINYQQHVTIQRQQYSINLEKSCIKLVQINIKMDLFSTWTTFEILNLK